MRPPLCPWEVSAMNRILPISQRKKPWLREGRIFSRRHAWGFLVRLWLPGWGCPPPAQALPGRRDRQELKTEQLLSVPPPPGKRVLSRRTRGGLWSLEERSPQVVKVEGVLPV